VTLPVLRDIVADWVDEVASDHVSERPPTPR
jgi:hypothetical protein